jgi:hypothetical protein
MKADHDADIWGDDDVECACPRYTALVMLVRHLLALENQGTYADGVPPDNVAFTRTWVRARLSGAVRPGVLGHDEPPDHCATRWRSGK